MKKFSRQILWLLVLGFVLLGVVVAAAAWWGWGRAVPMAAAQVDYIVESGSTPRQIARGMRTAGIQVDAIPFTLLARFSGRDKLLKAGAYEARRGDTLWQLLERMAAGDMTQVRLTFPEGWTFAQMRAALDADPQVRHDTAGLSDRDILQRLGLTEKSPEGLFYPDTYVFSPGSTDIDILRRAAHAARQVLSQLWAQRDPDLPLKDPYQALILASLVEKETGHGEDRARIAGVFINRLKRGMPLQTDPSVIYGLGTRYQGRLRKKDLEEDTPWNTYTRAGLPPTPIANPGRAALFAALHPDHHDYLYFVSRGDGSSQFSTTLTAHNRAVNKYIRQRN